MSSTSPETESKKSRFGFSLDGWAVTAALALAALVWLGILKHVPW